MTLAFAPDPSETASLLDIFETYPAGAPNKVDRSVRTVNPALFPMI
jgi:hypothetical protein